MITGAITMDYFQPVYASGWWVVLFLGCLWIITMTLLSYRIEQVKDLKRSNKRLTKLLADTL